MRSWILPCAFAYAACSPFTSTDPSTEPTATDAGSDAAPIVADSGTSTDSGVEAGLPSFRPSCTGTPTIEDAFDRPVPLASWWTNLETSPSLAPAIDKDLGLPARSLRVEVPSNDGAGDLVSRLVTSLTAMTFCLELDTFVETDPQSFGNDSYAEIVAVTSADDQIRVYLEVTQVGLRLATSTGQYANLPAFPFGAWAHLVLQVNLKTGEVTATTTGRDGAPQPPTRRTVATRGAATEMTARIGLLSGSTGSPRTTAPLVKALVDNVRLVSAL